MAEHNEIGKIGENITTTFLMKQGFSIVERNYRTKFGEIDIVAKKDGVLHFVEVKSVKVRDVNKTDNLVINPEDNLTESKWSKFMISTELYLKQRGIVISHPMQIDLSCVYVDTETRAGKVKLLQNVHKERG